MPHLDDFRIGDSEPIEVDPTRRLEAPSGPARGLVVGLVLVGLVLAGAGYLAFRWLAASRSRVTAPPLPRASPAPSISPAIPLPSLDQSDALVRELAGGLTTDPRLAGWLAGPGLVRTLAALVEKVAADEPPRTLLAPLAPAGSFTVVRKADRLLIDPRSYERYDGVADVLASLDAAACARAYRTLEPLLDAAYRELGHPEGGFGKVLERALATLQQTPVVEGDVEVRSVTRAVLVYELADPELETLSPAQKHLLRMGPRNTRKVQAKLGELQEALGATSTR